jgi:hypothetical protein
MTSRDGLGRGGGSIGPDEDVRIRMDATTNRA